MSVDGFGGVLRAVLRFLEKERGGWGDGDGSTGGAMRTAAWRACAGGVGWARPLGEGEGGGLGGVGFTVCLGQLCAIAFTCFCVCSRGGMAGCLAVPWWGHLHIQLHTAHDWVLVGGRAIFSLGHPSATHDPPLTHP